MKTLHSTLVAAVIVLGGYAGLAQGGALNVRQTAGAAPMKKMGPSMEMCKQMMADMKMEKAHMKDMDAKLEGLISTMDAATVEDKVNVLATIVKELVAQRTMMRIMKDKMDAKMMVHMMDHMKMPASSGKLDCPMMKDMMGGGSR